MEINIFNLFCSCDLDLDLMTFIFELDPYSLEMYRMCKNNFLCQDFRQLSSNRHTDRQTPSKLYTTSLCEWLTTAITTAKMRKIRNRIKRRNKTRNVINMQTDVLYAISKGSPILNTSCKAEAHRGFQEVSAQPTTITAITYWQTFHLSSHKASSLFHQYQLILHGDRGTCVLTTSQSGRYAHNQTKHVTRRST